MKKTLGKRIAELRKEKGLKQDALAEKLSVSPQAVSKWENDLTCPDISLLPLLAETLDVTVDQLLTGNDPTPIVQISSPEQKKDIKDMVLRIVCESYKGDKANINLPLSIAEALLTSEGCSLKLNGAFCGNDIDLKEILNLVHHGVVGNLMEAEDKKGDTVRIFVE